MDSLPLLLHPSLSPCTSPSSRPTDQTSSSNPIIRHNTTTTSSPTSVPPPPYFFPRLWLARRTKIVDILREAQVGSVADLGCGVGGVLQILSIPANHYDDFPTLYPPSPSCSPPLPPHSDSHVGISEKERKRLLLKTVPPSSRELHLRRLVGVDVDVESLGRAAEITRPVRIEREGKEEQLNGEEEEEEGNARYQVERERWEELRIELYHGAVETYSESLASGIEAMFATEVIEHMSSSSLDKFMPMILGVYSPRLFIITTPNHEFNPYFLPQSTSDESSNRFPDPTLRTQRIFRDDDHQFEFTQLEFESWAKEVALEHEYSVEFTGVGSLAHYYGHGHPIPFPPPSLSVHPTLVDLPSVKELPQVPEKFFATQIAIFTRHYSKLLEVERSPRSHRTMTLPFFSPVSSPISSPIFEKNLPLPLASPTSSLRNTNTNSEITASSRTTATPLSPIIPASPSSLPQPIILPLTKSPTLVKLCTATNNTQHKLHTTHLHPAHPTVTNSLPPAALLVLLAKLSENEFRKEVVSLREYWNVGEVRRAAGGAIGSLVEAVLREEEEEWDFVLLKDRGGYELKGDEALGIVWKGFVEGTREEEEQVADSVEEEEEEEEEVWNGEPQGELLSDQEDDDGWGQHVASGVVTSDSTW